MLPDNPSADGPLEPSEAKSSRPEDERGRQPSGESDDSPGDFLSGGGAPTQLGQPVTGRPSEPDDSQQDPYLRLGEVGQCVLRSRIGRGGMGIVYKGYHKDLDLEVAVKFLHAHLTVEPGNADRFFREARLAARLHSPGIVRVFTCGQFQGNQYIVMEYVDGQTLADHLGERQTIPVARALQIAEAIAQSLGEALRQIGLIHRDIKPGNILLTRDGQVKLADLGLAKMVSHADSSFQTAAGVALGTPSYMPPEQFTDAGQVDHRADIFSLGATLYEMLSGRPPFRGSSLLTLMKQIAETDPPSLPDEVPHEVQAVVARMMSKQPADRFQTHEELVTALKQAQHSLGKRDDLVHLDIAQSASPRTIPEVRVAGNERHASPTENRVLLVVDIQNDFCPDGALAVRGGDEVVPVINKLSRRFAHVILTQDWHCEDHLSFASSHPGKKPLQQVRLPYGEQILWPDHCVQRTRGAEFHPQLEVANCELIVRKGYHRDIDSYSAFFENDRKTPTGLAGYLRERGLTRLFIVGLATDFCVAYSALDASRLGFEVTVIEAGCRGIDVDGSLAAAWQQMERAGVVRA